MRNYFSHDSNAKNDEKILELRSELGWEGYGLYWAIVENLREAKQYRLKTNYKAIAMALGVQEEIVEKIVCDYDLFSIEIDNGREYFYSSSLRSRMAEADHRKEALSEAGKKGAEKRWGSPEIADEMAQDSLAMATLMANRSNKIKLKEKKEKENINKNIVVVCSSNESTVEEETKGFLFQDLTETERNNEKQQFFVNFFFKDFKNPKIEVEKFIEHNDRFHWIPKGGAEPLLTPGERLRWSDGWKPKTQPRTNNPVFLHAWKMIYDICARSDPPVAAQMLDTRTTSGKVAGGTNYIRCFEAVWRWIEANREIIHPLIREVFNGENWVYYSI